MAKKKREDKSRTADPGDEPFNPAFAALAALRPEAADPGRPGLEGGDRSGAGAGGSAEAGGDSGAGGSSEAGGDSAAGGPSSGRAEDRSGAGAEGQPAPRSPSDDAWTRARRLVVRREKKGRGGKTVTVIEGFDEGADLGALARTLARALGCGATAEEGTVVLQGGQSERVAAWLRDRGAPRVVVGS